MRRLGRSGHTRSAWHVPQHGTICSLPVARKLKAWWFEGRRVMDTRKLVNVKKLTTILNCTVNMLLCSSRPVRCAQHLPIPCSMQMQWSTSSTCNEMLTHGHFWWSYARHITASGTRFCEVRGTCERTLLLVLEDIVDKSSKEWILQLTQLLDLYL